MGKLSDLQQWLTISQAAAKLTECFNEEVSADRVFRLVLDKHLKLAVSFTQKMPAHRRDALPYCKSKQDEAANKKLGIKSNIDLDQVIWLPSGEYDIPMNESNDVCMRQLYTDRFFLELPPTDSPLIVENNTGEQFRLLGDNLEFEYPPGYPIPKGIMFVIRTKVLNDFIQSLQAAGSPTCPVSTVNTNDLPKRENDNGQETQEKEGDKPFKTKEWKSISIIIMSLAKIAKIDTEKHSSAADTIKCQAEELGLPISTNTISKFLKEARKVLHPE